MNISVSESEEEYFSVEDIVSYSNIEITHVNDNRAPMAVVAKKTIVWLLVLSMIAGIFFM
ncbi:MAG: hypothetical protein IJT36_07990 [Alphaproteobacteria bacterium]|nr:hypothetical protein [Alphaproteobacteria bacterium]